MDSRLFKDEQGRSPPPYEAATAYPKVPRRRFLLRKLFSFQVLLAITLTCAVSWLCLVLERETRLRDAARPVAHLDKFRRSLDHCAALRAGPPSSRRPSPQSRTKNPRWNDVRGQQDTVTLTNASLFDGGDFTWEEKRWDITFTKGLITSVEETTDKSAKKAGKVYDVQGRWVTPGLVDMHSHHSIMAWPVLTSNDDSNEVHPDFGPLTPFLRALDGMKAYDPGTEIIMSGGVTSSLIIPGSANIMGGEGTVVKNVLRSGPNSEYVVEELLLEHGVPFEERNRYMKLACGENPSRVYGHTRMANVWLLRKQLAKAKDLMDKQDEYCLAAGRLAGASAAEQGRFVAEMGGLPYDLELDSTIGLLRGRVTMQNHCYLPEDMEAMLRVSHEFGFRVRAFHHAIEAWEVPEMLKEYGENVTIATFAEFSLYKWEAYFPSLYAGTILADHGVPVAYKSDHVMAETNAKYLMSQAAVAHGFTLSAQKALQAVTSVPAAAIDMDHRIGYVRPGYDADIVVWDRMPLSVGATPQQVYIDGVPQLEDAKVKESMGATFVEPVAKPLAAAEEKPKMRVRLTEEERQAVCGKSKRRDSRFVVRGIKKSFIETWPGAPAAGWTADEHSNLTLVVWDGEVQCFGTSCNAAVAAAQQGDSLVELDLANGHLYPGITAITSSLGMMEIAEDPSDTGDGIVDPMLDVSDPAGVDYAKYGISLKGKAFDRARLGGITRAISPPIHAGGLMQGVSVGFLTGEDRTLLDGGLWLGDVAMHVHISEKVQVIPQATVSNAIKKLRQIILDGQGKHNATIYGKVASGKLPLIINADNQFDIQQIILFKKAFPDVNVVLQGGSEAPFVAKELAEAKIPVILTQTRPAPHRFRAREAVIGPPLTPSVTSYLADAGVFFAVAIVSEALGNDYRLHDMALEATWAAKYANLSEKEIVRLVTTNLETILGLKKSKDFVLWEGSPLEHGGTVVLAFHEKADGKFELSSCWPDEETRGHRSSPPKVEKQT